MSSHKNSFWARLLLLAFLLGHSPLKAQQGEDLKVMHYNLLRFGNTCDPISINQKADWLTSILSFYQPDIFTVNELLPEVAFENLMVQAARSYNPAMEAAGFTNEAGSDIVNDLLYNGDKLGVKSVSVLPGAFRDINIYTLFFKEELGPSPADTLFLTCIVAHFKAGGDEEDRELRIEEAREILNWVKARQGKGNLLLLGDLNFDNAREAGWKMLVDPDSTHSFLDPIELIDDWNGPNFAGVHTQSTRTTTPDCGVAGGLDDRFDFILLGPQTELTYREGSYKALGNAGNSFNEALGCAGGAVPEVICNTLRQLSDHLPVVMELQVDELVSTQVSLGDQILSISNPFTHRLHLRLKEELSPFPLHITLTSMEGKAVFHAISPGESLVIDLGIDFLPTGLYALRVSTKEGQYWVEKVMKR